MARRRRPVDPLQQGLAGPAVQPVASPVDVFFRPNTSRGAADQLQMVDLAPLSRTVAGYLAQKAERDAAEKAQAGERFVAQNPEAVARLEGEAARIKDQKTRSEYLRREFAKLQQDGEIPAAADPYFQIGYARSAAKLMLGHYRDRVSARMNEVSRTTDPNTGLPALPAEPEKILAEEWGVISDSPAIQNFYGGQAALGLKAQVDDEFRARAAQQRAQQIETEYRGNLARDIGQQFDRVLAMKTAVDSNDLADITAFVGTEVRGHNVQAPRELVLDALKLSFERAAATDPDEAVRAVYAAEDLVIENTRLGDDRSGVGVELQALKQRYREMAREQATRDVQKTEAKRKAAIQKGEDRYVPLLLQAKRDGTSVQLAAHELEAQILAGDKKDDLYGGNGAFVVDALHEYARHLDADRTSDQGVVQHLNVMVADGQLEAADALARSALANGELTGEDYHTTLNLLSQRRNVSEWVENSGLYNAVRGRYGEAKPTGFTPEVQQRLDDEVVDLQRKLERDFVQFVRSTDGKSNREELHRQWLQEREGADLATIRQRGTEIREKREEALRDVQDRFSRFDGAAQQIEDGLRSGALTAADARDLRDKSVEAVAQREQFYGLPEYHAAQAAIDAQFDAKQAGLPPTAEDVALRQAAHQTLRDRYDLALDGFLKDPSVPPAQFRSRARAALQEVQEGVGGQLFPEAKGKAIAKGVKAGKGAEEITTGLAELEADLGASRALAARVADPSQRERLDATIFGEPAPKVPAAFYKAAAAWQSGLDPFFGRQTTREDAMAAAYDAARALAPEDTESIGSILGAVGVDAMDVVRGRTSLEPSNREAIERELREQESLRRVLGPDPARDRQIEELRARTQPVTFQLEGVAWRPFTTPFFRSRESLAAFSSDPAWPQFLEAVGIDPDDQQQVDDFAKAQLNNIDRTNP